nr:hypothetical protein [Secundilactobacillus kimchicus]
MHLSNLTARFTLSGPNCQFTYPNGDQIDAVIAVYDTQVTQQQPLTPQPSETSEARFFCPVLITRVNTADSSCFSTSRTALKGAFFMKKTDH